MPRFLTDIKTKKVGHGGIDLLITFSNNTFEKVHFKCGDNIDDVAYALQILRLNLIEPEVKSS